MKWWLLVVLMLVLGIGMGWWVWEKNNVLPGYENVGVVTKNIGASLLVAPKAVNVMPFYTKLEDRSLYENDQYEVYEIKEKSPLAMTRTSVIISPLCNSRDT